MFGLQKVRLRGDFRWSVTLLYTVKKKMTFYCLNCSSFKCFLRAFVKEMHLFCVLLFVYMCWLLK